jgi:3D (Asp-Asp-Asp) domain-containing protein
MFIKTVKNIMIMRLVAAVILLESMPLAASAAFIDLDDFGTIGGWLKGKLNERIFNRATANKDMGLATVSGSALMPSGPVLIGVKKVYETFVTGYSASIDETDDTPLITASGAWVSDGVVAANFLPFGTKIRIPELFGNKIFTVQDRMHTRYSDLVDIWFESKDLAKTFGKRKAEIQVLDL